MGKISTYLAAGIQFIFGMIYSIRMEFMPYHAQALGLTWDELDYHHQTLFLAGMKIAAAAFISSSLSIAFLQYQTEKYRINWIPWLILFIGTMSFAGTITAILLVLTRTPGAPPYWLASIGWLLIITGFIFNRRKTKRD